MGEIKSTMDIIMEKLSKIKISEEDKKEILRKEAEGIADRLISTYLSKKDVKSILDEIAGFQGEKKEEVEKALIKKSIDKIKPYGEDNESVLCLIEALIEKDIFPIKERISLSEDRLKSIKERCKKTMLSRLKKRDIYGSAVIPNIEADSIWIEEIKKETDKLRLDVNDLISKLK